MASQMVAIPAPEGYIVNFDDPVRMGDTAGYWVFGVGIMLSFSFLCMRTYTKVLFAKNFAVEDIMWLDKAMGVHAWEIPIERYNLHSKVSINHPPTISFQCCSSSDVFESDDYDLLGHLRALARPIQVFPLALLHSALTILGYSFAIIFAHIFPCKPVAMNWDVKITDGSCINRAAIYNATAAVNIVTHIALLTLPIHMIVDLRMPRVSSAKVNSSDHLYDLETIGQKSSKKKRPSRYGMETLDDNDLELDGRYAEHKVGIAAVISRVDTGGRISECDEDEG
ncbi:hypothetical protein SBOR_0735 [Sclerotinia borealis F-4128]|uniref:Rhodopsin domain-containing protein n=1 Tax=Sclerotinia borealis (strain F-4128) TaxID=1432307 RepID=W9CQ09_SCLBF|nr:hypothetical protein SBOR_0735 [Sclerotinia borealis F-4128]